MKAIFILILTLFSTFTFAQLQKGNYLLGGSTYITSSKDESPISGKVDKDFRFNITPRFGYFISDKVAVGIDPGYNFKNTQSPSQVDYSSKSSDYSFMPYVRNYISVGDKFALFFHSSIGVSYSKTNTTQTTFDQNTGLLTSNSFQSDNVTGLINTSMGIAYFISSKWSIEATFATLSYNHILKQSSLSQAAENDLHIRYGLASFNFGAAFYINR